MVRVEEPVVVVGDVHGQYYDLLTLLDINKKWTSRCIFSGSSTFRLYQEATHWCDSWSKRICE